MLKNPKYAKICKVKLYSIQNRWTMKHILVVQTRYFIRQTIKNIKFIIIGICPTNKGTIYLKFKNLWLYNF